jgi:hypothetical protein
MPMPDWNPFGKHRETVVVAVDDRTLVLGLDHLFRDAMADVEAGRLLDCARTVAEALDVRPLDVPIEGYYAEMPALREYFQLVRALQQVDESAERRVTRLPEFRELWDLMSSGLYGRPERGGKLLPRGWDPLTVALDRAAEWAIPPLVQSAQGIAEDADDWSLVGLAARTADPVVITATRESVVLYAATVALGLAPMPRYRYEWRVSDQLAAAANRFIDTANRFVPHPLPRAEPKNAEAFAGAFDGNALLGRCVRLGNDRSGTRYYHWAIRSIRGTDDVEDFWSEDVWTTTRYRAERHRLT